MSVTTSTMDLISGASSFGISAVFSGLFKLIYTHFDNLKEERTLYRQYHLQDKKLQISDVNSARKLDNKSIRWTRRVLSLGAGSLILLPFFIMAVAYVCGRPTLVTSPVDHTHHFLFFTWGSTKLMAMQGFVYYPWMSQLLFTVFGFYFGVGVGSK